MAPTSSKRKLLLLATLYMVQGLPFGFQATALPAWMRSTGMSLTGVGLLGALAAPWMLKALWAPLVDRYPGPDSRWARFGRRKAWIVPLQALLALTCGAAALVDPARQTGLLLGLIFAMNLFAATQDIAVDGLAVELLDGDELGPGNAAQVVGYKVGMLVGGGLLVWASQWIGFPGLFAVMAGAVLAVAGALSLWTEPDSPVPRGADLRAVLRQTWAALRVPGGGWLLLFIATYKVGEAMVDAMFKPMLVDAGITVAQLGLWLGTWGMAFSMAGSLSGGLVARALPRVTAVGVCAVLRTVPMAAEAWLAHRFEAGLPLSAETVIAVSCAESFAGGMLTVAMFAFMMSRVDTRIGATHYTVLASVEVLGKSPGAFASGPLAEALGYRGLFLVGVGLSVGFLGLLWPLWREGRGP